MVRMRVSPPLIPPASSGTTLSDQCLLSSPLIPPSPPASTGITPCDPPPLLLSSLLQATPPRQNEIHLLRESFMRIKSLFRQRMLPLFLSFSFHSVAEAEAAATSSFLHRRLRPPALCHQLLPPIPHHSSCEKVWPLIQIRFHLSAPLRGC